MSLGTGWSALLVVVGAFVLAAVAPGLSRSSGRRRVIKAGAGALALACVATGFASNRESTIGERQRIADAAASGAGPGGAASSSTTSAAGGGISAAVRGEQSSSAGSASAEGGRGTRVAVTSKEVTIGLLGTANGQSGAASLGATLPDFGDPAKQRDAMVKWVNAHGGIAGRRIKVVERDYDLTSNDPTRATTICKAFTEDDHVFLVIGALGVDFPCYVAHKTPVIITASTNPSQAALRSYAPYVWLATGPDLSVAMAGEIDALNAQGWFSGDAKVAYFVVNTPDALGVYRNVVVPRIERLGHRVADMQTATAVQSFADIGRYAADAQAAILKWKAAGINRVSLIYPFGGALFIFAQQAEQAKFYPHYGVGSQDTPGTNQANVPPSQFKDALGSGVLLADIDDKHGDRFPAGAAERNCLDIMRAGGQRFAARSNAAVAMSICDGFLFMWNAARGIDANLSIASWAAGAGKLGTKYQSAMGLPGGSYVTAARPEASTTFRLLKYDSGCSCFVWTNRTQHKDPL